MSIAWRVWLQLGPWSEEIGLPSVYWTEGASVDFRTLTKFITFGW